MNVTMMTLWRMLSVKFPNARKALIMISDTYIVSSMPQSQSTWQNYMKLHITGVTSPIREKQPPCRQKAATFKQISTEGGKWHRQLVGSLGRQHLDYATEVQPWLISFCWQRYVRLRLTIARSQDAVSIQKMTPSAILWCATGWP